MKKMRTATAQKLPETIVATQPSKATRQLTELEASACKGAPITDPALSCGFVLGLFGLNETAMAEGVGLGNVVDAVQLAIDDVRQGDLSGVEGMLVAQSMTLQALFTKLARTASEQTGRDSMSAILQLALKCQAQSRATIDSLVNLKYPRTATFIKANQANVAAAGSQQQVNNGVPAERAGAREHAPAAPNELFVLENTTNGSTTLDSGTTRQAGAEDSRMEPVERRHRAENRKGQSRVRTQR